MVTPLPGATNVSMLDLLIHIDTNTGYFGHFLLFAIFSISFVLMKVYRTEQASQAAFFITTVLAWLFRASGIVGTTTAVVISLGLLISFLLPLFTKD